ncbi:MAG: hypothetical protein COV44_03940 [Deltaproteobacteria bacterium CG11_big_fil_rev_8_21_14_0_20_45_16]|nr:MAG: hypothetical protein COV44_03940 [Deltaproteobacteria bacterium CG11_big_fil_rev_8_21_14_0_20_45_16]
MGLSRGINFGFRRSKTDDDSRRAGQSDAPRLQDEDAWSNAIHLGQNQAGELAASEAKADVRKRFVSATRSGGEPSDQLNYLVPAFNGISDGWTRDGNRTLSEEDLLMEALGRHHLPLDFGNPRNSYISQLVKMSLWNIYNERGEEHWRDIFLGIYADEFDEAFDDAQRSAFRRSEPEGFDLGTDMGQHFAYQWGLIDTYNHNFKLASIDGFDNEYRGVYEDNFGERFAWYSNNAVLEFDYRNLQVFETGDFINGIFESGDPVGASMLLTNYGGARKNVDLKMIGNLAAATKTKKG